LIKLSHQEAQTPDARGDSQRCTTYSVEGRQAKDRGNTFKQP